MPSLLTLRFLTEGIKTNKQTNKQANKQASKQPRTAVTPQPLAENSCFLPASLLHSKVPQRSHGRGLPALPQDVLPAAVVGAALHHRHRRPPAEDPVFPQLPARGRWAEPGRTLPFALLPVPVVVVISCVLSRRNNQNVPEVPDPVQQAAAAANAAGVQRPR